MFIRIKLVFLLSLTLGFSFPFFWKKETEIKKPVIVEPEKPAPIIEEKKEEPKIEIPPPKEPDIFQSAVTIKSESSRTWAAKYPWQKENSLNVFGTGFIISSNQILTNAHVVQDAKYIIVKRFKDKNYFKAKVKFVGYDCDLALLEIEDSSFILDSPVVTISERAPVPGSEIMILGFPEAAENLSVERGTMTGIEKVRYAFSGTDFRNVIRVKTNIRSGFSGGPAIQNNKLTGLAFQINRADKDTAYLIPAAVIRHFLTDIQDGTYDGFPEAGFSYQSGENSALRNFLHIPPSTSGIMINKVFPHTSFFAILQENDFIYKINENELSNEGIAKVNHESLSGFSLEDLLESMFVGDEISIMFYREGKNLTAKAKLKKTDLTNIYRFDSSHFFTDSGLYFQPLSRTLIQQDDMKKNALNYHYTYFLTDNLYRFTERDIVLTNIYDDPENITGNKYKLQIIENLNGYTPKNLDHFRELWQKLANETIVIKFRGIDLPLILSPTIREQINVRIRKRYTIENN